MSDMGDERVSDTTHISTANAARAADRAYRMQKIAVAIGVVIVVLLVVVLVVVTTK